MAMVTGATGERVGMRTNPTVETIVEVFLELLAGKGEVLMATLVGDR